MLIFARLTSPWQPQPPITSATAHFLEVDLSLAITIPENEPSRSFSGYNIHHPPENEPLRSIFGGISHFLSFYFIPLYPLSFSPLLSLSLSSPFFISYKEYFLYTYW
jgi:hypothetical protein